MPESPTADPLHDKMDAAIENLQRSVKGLRLWLIILTVIIAAVPVLFIMGGMFLVSVLSAFESSGPGTSATDIAEAKKEIRGALGKQLESLTVKPVKRRDANAPDSIEFMESVFGESALYVEYRLKGAKPPVADIIVDEYEESGATSVTALLPTRGSLTTRLSLAQQRALMNAFAEKTGEPVGPVARYGSFDYEDYLEEPPTANSQVTISGKKYRRDQLWQVMVGRKAKGESITVSERANRRTLVFWLDPSNDALKFLGEEAVKSEVF